MDLYPAIDIRRGASVRLVQGDFERETVYGDPVETACSYLSKGARRLHVVDLEAAAGNMGANRGMVSRIVSVAADHSALVQVGGGVRDEAAVEELLAVGAWRIVIGTAALSDPEMVTHIAATYPGRIVVGLDYRMASNRRSEGGQGDAGNPSDLVASMMLATEGWTAGGHISMEDALAWFEGSGVAAVVVTDIGKDGTLGGPNLSGLKALLEATEIEVVASGGVSGVEDLKRLASLERGGRRLSGVIVGKALAEGRISLEDARRACGEV